MKNLRKLDLSYDVRVSQDFSLLEFKIVLLKSLVAPQLVYVLTALQTKHQAIKEINKTFFKFIRNDKGDKIKCKIMIKDYSEGGLKIIDITSFNKSLKAIWIKKNSWMQKIVANGKSFLI